MKLTKQDIKRLQNIERIYESEVKTFGNGAKISGNKKDINKKCYVLVVRE